MKVGNRKVLSEAREKECTVVICQFDSTSRADTRDTFFGEDSDGSSERPLDPLYT